MDERIPLLIDTDPGVDDALALLMAFADRRHRLLGLTIAAGNVGLRHTVANALKLCEAAGVDVPVYAGCPVPLVHAAEDAAYVHGQDGFGDTGYAPATRQAEAEHAALAIVRLAREYAGELLLVTLGPLTNLALALRLDPGLPGRVRRLVVMGGAVTGRGNTSVSAEFNIAFDPEAADVVFRSFPSFDLVDWEAVLRHGFAHRQFEEWLGRGGELAAFYGRISELTRRWSEDGRGHKWHSADAMAMAVALQPDGLTQVEHRYLAVELEGRLSRGATVVDWLQRSGKAANARLAIAYDQARFEAQLRAALGA
ncbi:MAG: nucleoside hydrolase [Arenimonas sp.]|nr:nucleoside hydrolase [Arenimonas sp.]